MSEIIAVVGATGAQGGGVVEALLARGAFRVRALTRTPSSDAAQALARRGCEVVRADLDDPASMERAFADCHGAFVVTNAWEPGVAVDEYEQGTAAVEAAAAAEVHHLVWSTLPNCREISDGELEVRHFTDKARVDDVVRRAGFPAFTFVEAPMYFQNLAGPAMGPQPDAEGNLSWSFPMSADAACIHNGDIAELGVLVARVFEQPDAVGSGQYLSMTPGAISWREIVDTLNRQGHALAYREMSAEAFDALPFPGAKEIREMMEFWERYTYFGPDADAKIARAQALVPEGFTSFADWASRHMPAGESPPTSPGLVDRYLATLARGDWATLETELAEDAVLITPHGHVRGREGIRAVLAGTRQRALDAGHGKVEEVRRHCRDGIGYLLARAEPAVDLGMHVVVADGGKIAAHTSTMCPALPFMEEVLRAHGLAQEPDDAVSANTRAVIDRHLSTFGNMEAFLANKAEDVRFITQAGVLEGREALGRAFGSDVDLAPEGYASAVETVYRTHVGRVGYLVYRAEPFVSLGMDTWVVRGDQIVVWAYAACPMLPKLPQWLAAAQP